MNFNYLGFRNFNYLHYLGSKRRDLIKDQDVIKDAIKDVIRDVVKHTS